MPVSVPRDLHGAGVDPRAEGAAGGLRFHDGYFILYLQHRYDYLPRGHRFRRQRRRFGHGTQQGFEHEILQRQHRQHVCRRPGHRAVRLRQPAGVLRVPAHRLAGHAPRADGDAGVRQDAGGGQDGFHLRAARAGLVRRGRHQGYGGERVLHGFGTQLEQRNCVLRFQQVHYCCRGGPECIGGELLPGQAVGTVCPRCVPKYADEQRYQRRGLDAVERWRSADGERDFPRVWQHGPGREWDEEVRDSAECADCYRNNSGKRVRKLGRY